MLNWKSSAWLVFLSVKPASLLDEGSIIASDLRKRELVLPSKSIVLPPATASGYELTLTFPLTDLPSSFEALKYLSWTDFR